MFLWWITLYHFLRLLLFFIGSYHFSTYKKLMIWCLFLLTSIEMFGIIHVAMCNRACRNKLKHGELSEWSKVQHSKFYGCLVVSSAGNPPFIRVFKIINRIFFSVLSCFSLQKFFDRNLSEEKADWNTHTESCPRGRRCSTRNHVISPKKWIFMHGSVSKWLLRAALEIFCRVGCLLRLKSS